MIILQKSHKKIWLKCEHGKHEDYLKIISDYTNNNSCDCPKCSKEKTESSYQTKLSAYLNELNLTVFHERDCSCTPINPKTGYQLPFDNEVIEYNLIIEVNGIQHYQLDGWHLTQSKKSNKTPQEEFEYQQWKDNYKKEYAIQNGYNYLEIPYYLFDEKDSFKELLFKTISNIK